MPVNSPYHRMRALIIDDVHHCLPEQLEQAGIEVQYQPNLPASQIIQGVPGTEILILRSKIEVSKAWIQEHPALRIIGRAGSGMDNIDVGAAAEAGIELLNAPEGNRDAVAEQTIGMLLSLLANIHKSDREMRQLLWNRESNRGCELKGKTVGIIGLGNTGTEVAMRLRSFGVRILAYDKYRNGYAIEGIEESNLDEIFREADILSFHVPLSPETNQWIDGAFIQRMAKPFYLLNLSRGGIMNTADICRSLAQGKILGFATDVLETEPPLRGDASQMEILNRLLPMENVLITPHIGGWTHESYRKISEVLATKIITAFRRWQNETR